MQHDERTLPRWAQRRLRSLRLRVDALQSLRTAHSVLQDRDWFTLPGPMDQDDAGPRQLWLLNKDHPFPVCSLSRGDVLLVGRVQHHPKEEG